MSNTIKGVIDLRKNKTAADIDNWVNDTLQTAYDAIPNGIKDMAVKPNFRDAIIDNIVRTTAFTKSCVSDFVIQQLIKTV
jgi:hypothetical protein